MKQITLMFIVLLSCCGISLKANAQAQELEQLALDIEKLSQLKSILKDMKQGYDIVSGGYNTIKDLSQGNFNLHKTFLDGLLAVSPTVRNYYKVAAIIQDQQLIIKEYKSAFGKFSGLQVFNEQELGYMTTVYHQLLQQSTRDLDDLLTVLTDGKLRASDDERLRQIDEIADNMQNKLSFLRSFNSKTSVLALQRAKEAGSIGTIKNLYGITY